jgi:para-nitrobenzyl esterase
MRALVLLTVSAGVTLSGLVTRAAAPVQWPVKTDRGPVVGVSQGETLVYRGIPYAAPPIGALRWMPPKPAKPWTEVRKADTFGNDCMQTPFPGDAAPTTGAPAEDCLTVNVWTPARSEKVPVLVWIHGGGFVNGAGSPKVYDGTAFARDGVVFVSLNYRLGRFGFFAHPALTQENPRGPLGNYGYMDQIAALRWVSQNIAAFGGDPGRVTVWGESAGGGSVLALLASPAAAGLFQQAIVDSGGGRPGGFGSTTYLREKGANGKPSAEETGLAFAKSVGIEGTDARALAALRALPAEKIVSGMHLGNPQPTTFSGPMVDGVVVPEDPGVALASGKARPVPLIVGANSAEFSFMGNKAAVDGRLNEMGSDAAELIRKGYADETTLIANLMSDVLFVEPARFSAIEMAKAGAPVYVYRFSYVPESLRATLPGAPHASELPFAFDTVAYRYTEEATAADQAAAKAMHAYWVDFVRQGDPNGAGRPAWPSFVEAESRLLNLTNDGPVPQVDPAKVRLDALAAARALVAPR